ncbi:MAG: hypothetical protein GWN07_13855 [Actinobacteria bacterium]|nr:hypothetical protein [Actinomycetota bacterium]NIS31429.1 hypothetical protein [Actinomycetota bacterium]NIU66547.1 hypothetical protein [Actinomycetota bacterium]NIW28351.1 hypothetical protein [Actinomycetota bacterium]NIX20852.1 hypothetical protein [Actinomycetota bacterium]
MRDLLTDLAVGVLALAAVVLFALVAGAAVAGIWLLGTVGVLTFAAGVVLGDIIGAATMRRSFDGELERHEERALWFADAADRNYDERVAAVAHSSLPFGPPVWPDPGSDR